MSQFRASALRLKRRAESLTRDQIEPPVDVDAIATRLGAEVRPLELSEDVNGVLYWEDGRKVMVVNAALPPQRRRVSLARQIGYLVLHRRIDVRVDDGLKFNVRSLLVGALDHIEDLEASVFALHLLAPDKWLELDLANSLVDFSDDAHLMRLADRYGVPLALMTPRLLLWADT